MVEDGWVLANPDLYVSQRQEKHVLTLPNVLVKTWYVDFELEAVAA